MSFVKVKLPAVNKTQVMDEGLATKDMQVMTRLLSACRYASFDDYLCATNVAAEYIEDAVECGGQRGELAEGAGTALCVILNNARVMFDRSERETIIADYQTEGFEVRFDESSGWQPVLRSGFKTFVVVSA